MKTLTKIAFSTALICGISACSASVEQTEIVTKQDHSTLHDHSGEASVNAKAKPGTYYATVKPGASITLNSILPMSMTSGSYQTVRLELQDGYTDGVMSVNLVPHRRRHSIWLAQDRIFGMLMSKPIRTAFTS